MSVTIQTGNSVTVQSGNRVLISAPGPQGAAGAAGASEWGDITGTLSDQTDLASELANKVTDGGTVGSLSFQPSGLLLADASNDHYLTVGFLESTQNGTLNIFLNDGASRTLTLNGDATINGTNTGNVSLAGTPDYITISGQTITRGLIDQATDVTGTLPVANGGTGITSFGTGIATALGVNVGTAGAPVINGGALGTPSSGTVTNLTGTASININGTVGATTRSTGAFTSVAINGATLGGVSPNFATTASTSNYLSVKTTGTGGTLAAGINCENSTGAGSLFKAAVGYTGYKTIAASDLGFYNGGTAGNISIINDFSTGNINFTAGGAVAAQVTIASTGNVTIAADLIVGTAARITAGTGSPEGVKTAAIGSLYLRTDGGAGTTLYVKESGTGSTGWVAK